MKKKNMGFWIKLAWKLVKGKLAKAVYGKPYQGQADFCFWLAGEFIQIKTDKIKDDTQQVRDFVRENKQALVSGVGSLAELAAGAINDESKRKKVYSIIAMLQTELNDNL